jgi:hypothetical protein
MATNKYNQLIEACDNLKSAMSTIIEMWNNPQIGDIINESNGVYPFTGSFDDELFPKVWEWCDAITDNVKRNYLRIPNGGDGYARYDIISNDFCYSYDEDDDDLNAEWIFDHYFNYMYYGTHDEKIEAQFDTLAEAEKAFSAYNRGDCEIKIDKENHTISGKIYYIQMNEYDSNGDYETDGSVYAVMTGLGYYGMENE